MSARTFTRMLDDWPVILAAAFAGGLILFGLVMASLSHAPANHCPPGWKPNTGYLQAAGSCVRK